VARTGDRRHAHRILVGRNEEGLGVDGKMILKKKTDLQEEGWASMSWIDMAQKMDK